MGILFLIVYVISILGMLAIATITVAGSKSPGRVPFAVHVYLNTLWLSLQFFMQIFNLGDGAGLFMAQMASALSLAMALSFYVFTRIYTHRPLGFVSYIIFCVVMLLGFIANLSGYMISEAHGDGSGIVIDNASIFYTLYILIVGVIFISSVFVLRKYSKILNKKEKKKNLFVIFGFLQAIIAIVAGNVVFLNSSAEYQMIIPISLLLMAILIGSAIIKYQFFDIKFAILRTSAYLLSLITLAVVYFGLAYLTSIIMFNGQTSQAVSVNPVNIILALLLAFIFQPVKKFFDKITNHIFYKHNYNTDDFFAKLNKILGFTTDLRGLLERTATEIAKTLKGEQAFFFINTGEGHFATAGTSKHKQLPKSDADQFSSAMVGKNGVIIASLMEDTDPIKRMMISHRIELVLPLAQDGKVMGYLCLGDHLTSNYTNRDIKVLNTISNELIIAIQNALAVQEIREFNITLQQRIANATRELRASNAQLRHLDKAKDEFLSMASHQLRTPLTSVKGYISMIMDGDVGRVSTDQKKLLGEAFNNSERMVGLINDFLSISRIQTGRFVIEKTPIDLSLVVEQEVNSLRANATARQMELVYERPEDLPIMDIDEGKIRQVIMNFIDNAIYYSHPNTKININLSVAAGEILFTVKDTGIGVPKAERDQLFTKFFRATNAKKTRPDGSGVGLFLAKKVVDDHDGKIIFDSVEGQGSTFGFSLPIKPLVAASDNDNIGE